MVGTADFWNKQEGQLTRHETAKSEQMRRETRQREFNLEIQNQSRMYDAIDGALDEYFTDFGNITISNDTTKVVQVSVKGSMMAF